MTDREVETADETRLVRVAEPMTRFKCNEKGCCCQGWQITFDADDVYDLVVSLPESEREDLLDGAQVSVEPDTNVCTHIRLKTVGHEAKCRFLEGSGGCRIHATIGPQVLPNLCRVYPGFAYKGGAEDPCHSELHFDPVCPEVLERIDESDGPYEILEIQAGVHAHVDERSRRTTIVPKVRLGEMELSLDALQPVRGAIIDALNERSRPALTTLAWVNYALADLLGGESPTDFEVVSREDTSEFDRYFDACVASHQPEVLGRFLRRYRRFVFAGKLPEGSWEAVDKHLAYDPLWRKKLEPTEAPFDRLIARYLAHRFFDVFDPSRGDAHLSFRYRSVAHGLAAAFRIAVGIASWLQRPVDRETLKVSIGAAEYFFRSVSDLRDAMPWFVPDTTQDGAA